jgi:hypothetical protein
MRSTAATKYKAQRGRMAREAITHARMLDVSRYPLKKALSSARAIRNNNIHILRNFRSVTEQQNRKKFGKSQNSDEIPRRRDLLNLIDWENDFTTL